VALPLFSPGEDPGPDFAALLQRSGQPTPSHSNAAASLPVPHATTVVALRFAGGIVMAGDRRATEGHVIAHRAMEKVFPADRWSAVAIAGAAGPAVEMVRLFQVQLEHYEKVEGISLSLEGKANQLAQMVRGHLPMAMQGLVVVPLFAGYDQHRGTGRIYTYDVTGGHYEETDFQATGSGGRDARTTIKLGYRDGMSRDEAVELAIESLYEAADEDSGTGGPDLVRGIYPLVAVVDAEGYAAVSEEEVAERFAVLLERQRARRQPAGDTPAGARRSSRGGRSR
jgi:proteasome beta subunit